MGRLIVFLVTLTLLNACNEENGDADRIVVGIDVQSFFDQDLVQIAIDNKEVLNKRLQTGTVLAVCSDGRINTNLKGGRHEIRIVINNSTVKTEAFSLTEALYIGINYVEQTKTISLVYSDHPFGYK